MAGPIRQVSSGNGSIAIAVDGDDWAWRAFDADFHDARRIEIDDAHAHVAHAQAHCA